LTSGSKSTAVLLVAHGSPDRAEDVLRREVQLHLSQWEERSRIYQTIRWDVRHIRDNVARVKEGAKPVPLERVRVQRLLLPKPAAAS